MTNEPLRLVPFPGMMGHTFGERKHIALTYASSRLNACGSSCTYSEPDVGCGDVKNDKGVVIVRMTAVEKGVSA